MDTIFMLPLFIMACMHCMLCLLLLIPAVRLPVAKVYQKLAKGASYNSVQMTLALGLGLLLVSCVYELLRHGERASRADVREVVSTIDYLRAQVSCVLCTLNLLALFASRALAAALCAADHSEKNLDAMKRQVKGLQAEYQRATTTSTSKEPGPGVQAEGEAGELGRLRKQVDRLIAEKDGLQAAVDAANKDKKTAEASVTAMKSQIKGFDLHFDKLLEDNQVLKRRLMTLGDNSYEAEVRASQGRAKGE